jgi:hypothetical protein
MILIDEILGRLRAKCGVAVATLLGVLIFGPVGCVAGIASSDGFLSGLERAKIGVHGDVERDVVFASAALVAVGGMFAGAVKGSGITAPLLVDGILGAIVVAMTWVVSNALLGIWLGVLVAGYYLIGTPPDSFALAAKTATAIIFGCIVMTMFISVTALPLRRIVAGIIHGAHDFAAEASRNGNSGTVQFTMLLMWLYLAVLFGLVGTVDGTFMYGVLKLTRPGPIFGFDFVSTRPASVIVFAAVLGFLQGSALASVATFYRPRI